MKMSTSFFALFFGLSVVVFAQPSSDSMEKGKKFFAEENYKGALLAFNEVINSDTKSVDGYFWRATTKKEFGDLHGAMKDYNEAIALNPKYAAAYFERGNIKFSLQDYYGSIEDYSKSISLDDSNIQAYLKRGQAKHMVEAYEDAINDCTKILEMNPENVDAYYLRGVLRIEHGQTVEGCLDLSKAGELGDIRAYDMIKERCNKRFN